MANTVSIEALDDGTFKISVHSAGERDMSAKVSPDELDAMLERAHNDVARGAYGEHPKEPHVKEPEPRKSEWKK